MNMHISLIIRTRTRMQSTLPWYGKEICIYIGSCEIKLSK